MKSTRLKNELVNKARQLNRQIEQLEKHTDSSDEDLEGILATIAQLQGKVIGFQLLKEWEGEKLQEEKAEEIQTTKDEKKVEEIVNEPEVVNKVEPEEPTPAVEEKKEVPKVEVKSEPKISEEDIDAIEKEQTESKASENENIKSKQDLNELFHSEKDPSLSGQLRKQPIADLLTAIGLNERYLYANELFGGSMEDFKEAIRILNECENLEAASSYCKNELQKSFGWEDDNELFKALVALVERRYL